MESLLLVNGVIHGLIVHYLRRTQKSIDFDCLGNWLSLVGQLPILEELQRLKE